MFSKSITELTFEDVERLVEDVQEETINLDYKENSPADTSTKELAKDVSALANTCGGLLVYGISEKEHYKICGIKCPDDIKERIENKLVTSITPQVYYLTQLIEIPEDKRKKYEIEPDNNCIFVIYVPQSYNTVHMVVVKNDNRYYKRLDKSSVPMNEDEVRMKYNDIGVNKEYIEKKFNKIRERLSSTLYTGQDNGLMIVSVSTVYPFKNIFKSDDYEHFLRSNVNININHRQDRIFAESEGKRELFEIHFDGIILFGNPIIRYKSDKEVLAPVIYHDLYYFFVDCIELLKKTEYHGYLKIFFDLIAVRNNKLCYYQLIPITRFPDIKEDFHAYNEIYDRSYFEANYIDIAIKIMEEIYLCAGLKDIQDCFNNNDKKPFDKDAYLKEIHSWEYTVDQNVP